jgi:hypothetical protein
VAAAVSVGPTTISLSTEPAHHKDYFHHASIRFHTTRYPRGDFQGTMPAASQPEAIKPEDRSARLAETRSRDRRGFFSFCSSVWSGVKTLAKTVEAVVQVAYVVTKTITTGNLSLDRYQSIYAQNWNYDLDRTGHWEPSDTKDVQIDGSMTCDKCFFAVDVGVQFNLEVESSEVTLAQVFISGDAKARIGFFGDISAQYSKSGERLITTISGGPYSFMVGGIPVVITSNMSVVIFLFFSSQLPARICVLV